MTATQDERGERLSVLLVDDNERTQRLLASLVDQESDWTLWKPVLSAEELLQLPPEPIPDLIFLDYDMPGTTGLRVLPLLRAKWPTTYIVVLTHYDDDLVRKAALTTGADDFWSKWDLDEVRMHDLAPVMRGRRASPQA